MALSEYEREQLKKVAAHKERTLRRKSRRLFPVTLDGRAPRLFGKVAKLPGLREAKDQGAALLDATATGAGKFMTRTAQLTTSDTHVIGVYARKGHSVALLEDISKLDLRTIDEVASFALLHHAYSISAALEGAAAGLAINSGEVLATAGAVATGGVAAAPGLGSVVAAMGVDAAALLTACTGVVARDALYYGYDPQDPAEEIFMMQVIGLALATTAPAKAAAYQQLAKLTESLARHEVWHQLDQQTFDKVAQRFAVEFSHKLMEKRLFQLVPVVGVGIGAALNWKTVAEIADAAYWVYRERFLYEKGGGVEPIAIDVDVTGDGEDSDDGAIDVIDILTSEGVQIEGVDTDEE
ncbi:EcsC family protein [Mycobacterium sp. Dal123C01]|uniref:EcsC family protein n=1 Tax=Mycobacterium sp. Dal123C01 TaxID=3457577 RepID=UPI00403EDBA5